MRFNWRFSSRNAPEELGSRWVRSILVVMAIAPTVHVKLAHAQSLRTYVSGSGKDNPYCNVRRPCRTFQGALAQTAAGGEVYALDSADYGSVIINKAVTIASKQAAGILAGSNVSGVIINAGSQDVVTLRGLDIDGAGSGSSGIQFTSGAALNIQNCLIRAFVTGIAFTPSGSSALTISGTLIHSNTIGIRFQTSATNTGVLNDVQLFANDTGIVGMGTSAVPAIIAVEDSLIASNSSVGILSNGYSTISVTVSTIANNGIGLQAQNAGALLQVSGSSIGGAGAAWLAANGGNVISSGSNSTKPRHGAGYLLDGSGGFLLDANGQKLLAQ
jgi:Right handed beta helix region